MVSTMLTPILRENVHCFDELSCYSLAFGVPGALMIVAIRKYLFTFVHPSICISHTQHKRRMRYVESKFVFHSKCKRKKKITKFFIVSLLRSYLHHWQAVLYVGTTIGQHYRENQQMYYACIQNSVKRTPHQTQIPFSRLCRTKIWQTIGVRYKMFGQNTRFVHSVPVVLGTVRSAKFTMDLPSNTNEWLHLTAVQHQARSSASFESCHRCILCTIVQLCYLPAA